MGCANSKVGRSETGLGRRIRRWFHRNKVAPAPLDDFHCRLINQASRPKSASGKISLDVYVPEVDSDEDEPRTRTPRHRRNGVRLPPLKPAYVINPTTGKKAVNMLSHFMKKGIFNPHAPTVTPNIAFHVPLDKRPLPPTPSRRKGFGERLTSDRKTPTPAELEEKLQKAAERRMKRAGQKKQRLRLKSAKVDKVLQEQREAETTGKAKAKAQLQEKLEVATERREAHTQEKKERARLKSARVREVKVATEAKQEEATAQLESNLKAKLEKGAKQREQLQEAKITRVKRTASAALSRKRQATVEPAEESNAFEGYESPIETYHGSSAESLTNEEFYA